MTMPAEVKATHALLGLAANAILGDVAAANVARRAESAVAAIRGAMTGGWIPVELELAVVEAVAAECGLDGVRRRVRHQVLRSADGPLLKPIREGAMRLLGVQPSSLLRFSSQGWRTSFRGCGELAWSGSPQAGVLSWTGAPPLLAASRPWAECLAGAVEAIYDLCSTGGTVVVTSTNDGATYTLAW